MSGLERLAAPILTPLIQGTPTLLEPEQQHALARWMTKMSMVFQYAHPEPRPAFTEADRLDFYKSGTIPRGMIVWLASYWGKRTFSHSSHDLKFLPAEEAGHEGARRYNGYVATFTIGYLVFRCVRVPITEVPDAGVNISHHTSDFIVVIHPPTPLVHIVKKWPPARVLNDEGLEQFTVHLIEGFE
jgi:hypothetical protein